MIDIYATLQLASAAFEAGLQWSDLMLVYRICKGGTINFASIAENPGELDSLGRLTGALSGLLRDPKQRPKVVALLQQVAAVSK